jgi:hypothetical protein
MLCEEDSEIFDQIHVELLDAHFGAIVLSCEGCGSIEKKLFCLVCYCLVLGDAVSSEEDIR